jgi:hypothetical protein
VICFDREFLDFQCGAMRARQGGFFADATWVSEMLEIALNPAVVALYANCTLTSHIFAVPCHFGALRARTTEEGKMRNRFCFIEYLGVGAGDGNRIVFPNSKSKHRKALPPL